MRVLAIDSAMNGCQACVCEVSEETRVLAQETQKATRGQAEHLMPMVERMIEESEVSYSTLDLIGVTNGPGAFTGMRVAIATAKALALASNKPVVGVPTINAVLGSYLSQKTQEERVFPFYAVILETKRNDYYFQMFEVDTRKGCISMDDIVHHTAAIVANASEISAIISTKDVLLIGDAQERFLSECNKTWPSHIIMMPEGGSVAKLAKNIYQTEGGEGVCKPIYMREAEIGKSKTISRVIKT